MKCPLPSLVGLLAVLALLVGAWGQGYAQARPPAAELVAMTICAESGMETVLLDARGRPVQPDDCAQGLCPDCLSAWPQAAPTTTPLVAPQARTRRIPAVPRPARLFERRHPAPLPRGPPRLT